jgi:large subunit ribosomal protein L2
MVIKTYKGYSPGIRFYSSLSNNDLSKSKPEKSLTKGKVACNGRNNRGIATLKGRGNSHKRKQRVIDYRRIKNPKSALVASIEYDPNRNCRIALLHHADGLKSYILCPLLLRTGMSVLYDKNAPLQVGNSMPLSSIPLGSIIHNVEITLGKGGQIARAAGVYVQLIAKEGNYVTLKLPSGEYRLLNKDCSATIGQIGNIEFKNLNLGKAGRKRWLGRRPTVRGVAKNPNDHPHGGGEGRSPIGKTKPLTP